MSQYSNMKKGAIFLVLSALGFAIMSIFVRLSGDIPATQKVVFRNVISGGVAFYMVTRNKLPLFGQVKHRKYLLLRSLFGTIGMVLFFYSIDNLPVVSDAMMLNKLSTFFLILFSAMFLKEKIKMYQFMGIVIAFLGTILIIKPSFSIEVLPYMASVTAAMFAGAAYTMLRLLGQKESIYTVVLFFSIFSVLFLLPFVIYQYQAMTFIQVIYLLAAGLFATVGQFGITLAYKYASASEISIFNYFNVLFAGILGYIVFQEMPDYISLIGYILIFSASYYVFRRNKRTV